METYHINPFLFFLVESGKIICWDYKNHQQFELEPDYFFRLLEITNRGLDSEKSNIDHDLIAENLISKNNSEVAWQWDALSKIFHIGTQDIPLAHSLENIEESYKDYLTFCENSTDTLPIFHTEKSGEKITLPPPEFSALKNTDLFAVFKKRKTYRSFNSTLIPLATISTLLFTTFGSFHSDWSELSQLGLEEMGVRKTSPSGGALHPSEAYLLAFHIDGLNPGIYHYQSHTHTLTKISDANLSNELGRLLSGQFFAEGLSAGVFATSRFEKIWGKYKHSRAYRVALFDIGHLSQTFQLCATALDLHPWLTAMFDDSETIRLLNLTDTTEYPLFFMGVGIGDGSFLDEKFKNIIAENKIGNA